MYETCFDLFGTSSARFWWLSHECIKPYDMVRYYHNRHVLRIRLKPNLSSYYNDVIGSILALDVLKRSLKMLKQLSTFAWAFSFENAYVRFNLSTKQESRHRVIKSWNRLPHYTCFCGLFTLQPPFYCACI